MPVYPCAHTEFNRSAVCERFLKTAFSTLTSKHALCSLHPGIFADEYLLGLYRGFDLAVPPVKGCAFVSIDLCGNADLDGSAVLECFCPVLGPVLLHLVQGVLEFIGGNGFFSYRVFSAPAVDHGGLAVHFYMYAAGDGLAVRHGCSITVGSIDRHVPFGHVPEAFTNARSSCPGCLVTLEVFIYHDLGPACRAFHGDFNGMPCVTFPDFLCPLRGPVFCHFRDAFPRKVLADLWIPALEGYGISRKSRFNDDGLSVYGKLDRFWNSFCGTGDDCPVLPLIRIFMLAEHWLPVFPDAELAPLARPYKAYIVAKGLC